MTSFLTVSNDEKSDVSSIWEYKAIHCPKSNGCFHAYIPICWLVTPTAKHVKTLLCTQCFHELNISDIFEHRTKI